MKTLFKKLFNISDYSREKRLEIYKQMEEALELYYNSTDILHPEYGAISGFCFLLSSMGYDDNIKRNFPELWKTKPKVPWDLNPNFWFPTNKRNGAYQRVDCLGEAITELEIKLGGNKLTEFDYNQYD